MTDSTRIPSPPEMPARLPCGLTPEQVMAWVESVSALANPADRARIVRGELAAIKALAKYLRGWRSHHASAMYAAGAAIADIAQACGVSDSYVSRRVRETGQEPRRPSAAPRRS